MTDIFHNFKYFDHFTTLNLFDREIEIFKGKQFKIVSKQFTRYRSGSTRLEFSIDLQRDRWEIEFSWPNKYVEFDVIDLEQLPENIRAVVEIIITAVGEELKRQYFTNSQFPPSADDLNDYLNRDCATLVTEDDSLLRELGKNIYNRRQMDE
jgi:hypothetical protein